MRRYISIAFVAAVTLGGAVLPALAQSDPAARLQKLQQLKEQREAARQAALSAAAQNPPPPPTVTAIPTQTVPRPTFTPPPPPPPTQTVPRPQLTATTPRPQFTATPTATTTAPPLASTATVASARPKTVDPAKVVDTVAASVEKLRTTRADRRHADVEKMQQRWGEIVSDGRAQAELRLHAQRVAYLQRIRAFAERANDAKLIESVDLLITQEERRDGEALNALRSGAAK